MIASFVVTNGHKMVWNLGRRATTATVIPFAEGIDVFRDGRTAVNTGSTLEVRWPSGEADTFELPPQLASVCGQVHADPFGSVAVLLCGIPDPDGALVYSIATVDTSDGQVLRWPVAVEGDFGTLD